MKKGLFIVLLVLVYSCKTNQITNDVKVKNKFIFENELYSFSYPKTWKELEPIYIRPNIVFSPKTTIKEGYSTRDLNMLSNSTKKMTKGEFDRKSKGSIHQFSKVYIVVTSDILKENQSFQDYINQVYKIEKKNFIKSTIDNIIDLTDKSAIVSNVVQLRNNPYSMNALTHFVLSEGIVYKINYTSPENEYSKYLSGFSKIISSFKIKKLPKN